MKEIKARATEAKWQLIKTDYIAGNGSLRVLAVRHGVSESTTMKRAAREHWEASRTLARSASDAAVVATLEDRAAAFVNRTAIQTDKFLTRVSESEEALDNEDRVGLRQLTGAFKDVVQVGRDTFNLGSQDAGPHCIVNLGFLQTWEPVTPNSVAPVVSDGVEPD